MKKIFALIAITFISLSALANGVEILGIYYILDNSNYTASVTYTSEYYYSDNTYSGAIDIPDGFYYEGLWYNVTSIGEYAFSGCSSLTSVTIPQNVTSIGNYAFKGCYQLSSITIPNSVHSIGDWAFSDTGLEAINIGENIVSIGDWAFSLCNNLTEIKISSSVKHIGERAFH